MRTADTARPALIDAFTSLMMTERFSRLTVQRLCAQAQVGRSTFYMHFQNLTDILMVSIAPMIDDLAAGLIVPAHQIRAQNVIEHFWKQRRLSELWRDAAFRDCFEDALTNALGAYITDDRHVSARYCAAGVTATIRHWISGGQNGRIIATPKALTSVLANMASSGEVTNRATSAL